MTTVSLPKGNVALGWADVGGQRIPVTIDMEWMRALSDLVKRAGGTVGEDTTTIARTAAQALSVANSAAQFSLYQRPQAAPIAGFDMSELLLNRVFNRTPPTPQTPADDAASILATRVFRK